MTKEEFDEYVMSDHMLSIPSKHLPDGSICFENIHIFWFKTSEKLPEPNRKCYGAYWPKIYSLEKDSTYISPIIRDNIRFNDKKEGWEWLFEAGYDYWANCMTPDCWAYQELPIGPGI